MYTAGNALLRGVTFEGNYHRAAGAVFIDPKPERGDYDRTFVAEGCTWRRNTAVYAGAIWHMQQKRATAAYTNCTFDSQFVAEGGESCTQSGWAACCQVRLADFCPCHILL